jgi:hypothetical protein
LRAHERKIKKMSAESNEFVKRAVDESMIEYVETAERKAEEGNAFTDYLESLPQERRGQAVLFLASYCSVSAPSVMQNAIAIHKVEYPS